MSYTSLHRTISEEGHEGQVAHTELLPAHAPRYADPAAPLLPALSAALEHKGITRLYTHQAAALDAARAGQHVGVVTATASGKTLCYQLPALEAILAQPYSRALFLFPTKALAHDQLRSLRGLCALLPDVQAATIDGDTPRNQRDPVRRTAQILLSNPDMLHRSILPDHSRWGAALANLRYVVIDEAHMYRGVFGSHVALVLRRLRRLCASYGAEPQFICCSATSANPQEHLEALIGAPVTVLDDDGAPQGEREFVFWNPPLLDDRSNGGAGNTRRSTNVETATVWAGLVRSGVKSLAFSRSRRGAELILRYARDMLDGGNASLTGRIASYRAGYNPDERRRLEQRFVSGDLLGVVSTNALELGVDIGGVDAVVLGGYPGTIASTWQQIGRAGRSQGRSLAVLVAQDDPMDQFYMRHPDEFFRRSHEHARVALDNPYILVDQIVCAAAEQPLRDQDADWFGATYPALRDWLLRKGRLHERNGRVIAAERNPAAGVNIRSADGSPVLLRNSDSGRQIEQIADSRATSEVFPGAVYLSQGETYLVERLALDERVAEARPATLNFYTQPLEVTDIVIKQVRYSCQTTVAPLHHGIVNVTRQVTGFRRKQHYSEAMLGEFDLDLPTRAFITQAVWFTVPPAIGDQVAHACGDLLDALHALEHAMIGVLPLYAQCDRRDIGGLSIDKHPDTGQATVFVYDGVPGGVGITRVGYEQIGEWWRATCLLLEECPCEDGCPACVQSPKCGNGNQMLDKQGALALVRLLLGGTLP